MQDYIRCACNDSQAKADITFLYGRSTSNQRIEAFWSKVSTLGLAKWVYHFGEMHDNGLIDTSDRYQIECVRFCYMSMLQDCLDKFVTVGTHIALGEVMWLILLMESLSLKV